LFAKHLTKIVLTMPSKHVIVGGLGNLGRHLQRVLLEQGHAVKVVDLPTSASVVQSRLVHPSVEYVPYQLGWMNNNNAGTSQEQHSALVEALHQVETVHSVVTPDVQTGTVREFDVTNRLGLQHLVTACLLAGVQKLVCASSLAVTNHLQPSVNQTEDDPLPPMESYTSSSDRTKWLGEEIVLQANDKHHFRPCSLRLGGLIASPNDFMFRSHFQTGSAIGRIFMSPCQPIDFIAASDVATAMALASTKLDRDSLTTSQTNELAGRAVFVTKSRNAVVPSTEELAHYLADLMGWKVIMIPRSVVGTLQVVAKMQHAAMSVLTSRPDDLPGVPTLIFLDYTNHEKTFDNSLAHRLLGFQPELSWEQAVEAIVDDYCSSLSSPKTLTKRTTASTTMMTAKKNTY